MQTVLQLPLLLPAGVSPLLPTSPAQLALLPYEQPLASPCRPARHKRRRVTPTTPTQSPWFRSEESQGKESGGKEIRACKARLGKARNDNGQTVLYRGTCSADNGRSKKREFALDDHSTNRRNAAQSGILGVDSKTSPETKTCKQAPRNTANPKLGKEVIQLRCTSPHGRVAQAALPKHVHLTEEGAALAVR